MAKISNESWLMLRILKERIEAKKNHWMGECNMTAQDNEAYRMAEAKVRTFDSVLHIMQDLKDEMERRK